VGFEARGVSFLVVLALFRVGVVEEVLVATAQVVGDARILAFALLLL
jgi:hypothetical protein